MSKKRSLQLVLFIAIQICLVSCGGRTNNSTSLNTTQDTDTVATESNVQEDIEVSVPSVCGTYEFSDDFNTWELIVNADETATIRNKSQGGETLCYGSWDKIGDKYWLEFHDMAPKVWFKGEGDFKALYSPILDVENMWIYKSSSDFESKNPNKRLKITKTAEGKSVTTVSKSNSENPINVCGTYEFSDGFNTWELVVNADETATIRNKSQGGETLCYGSWDKIGDKYWLEFHDMAPKVWFKGEGDFKALYSPILDVENMWIYKSSSDFDSKNPNKRLKISKK